MSVKDDITSGKAVVLGVIAFATAVATFLVNVLGFPLNSTLAMTIVVSAMVLCQSWLVDRAEKRQSGALQEHITSANQRLDSYDEKLEKLLELAKIARLSNLRAEMNRAIDHTPEDHNDILKCAERYFVELKGDWVETDLFLRWIKNEEEKGRPVNVPLHLMNAVTGLKAKEDGAN